MGGEEGRRGEKEEEMREREEGWKGIAEERCCVRKIGVQHTVEAGL
jgi:hypothetical protein